MTKIEKIILFFILFFVGFIYFQWYTTQKALINKCMANYEQCQKDYYKATGNN